MLETLVIDADENTVPVPGDRYARGMVHFILCSCAEKLALAEAVLQISALWMCALPLPKSSDALNGWLPEFLGPDFDPHDPSKKKLKVNLRLNAQLTASRSIVYYCRRQERLIQYNPAVNLIYCRDRRY